MAQKVKAEKSKSKQKLNKNSKVDKYKSQIQDLKLELENIFSELENLKDKNVRLLAEFDNYKRRSINERKNLTKYAGESFIKGLLPIIDDFSRTIESIKEDSSLKEGVLLVKNKLEKTFEENGIMAFESIGFEFDPELHEALMSQESDECDEGTILNEFEKGYKYHDKILRHAKVIVSKAKQEA